MRRRLYQIGAYAPAPQGRIDADPEFGLALPKRELSDGPDLARLAQRRSPERPIEGAEHQCPARPEAGNMPVYRRLVQRGAEAHTAVFMGQCSKMIDQVPRVSRGHLAKAQAGMSDARDRNWIADEAYGWHAVCQ